MPFSSNDGKSWLISRMRHIADKFPVKTVMDIGVGAGTYAQCKAYFPGSFWHGLEVYEPYVEKYNLINKYDNLIIHDARTLNYADYPHDLAIMGDVLEHMTLEQAQELVKNVLAVGKLALVSIPIVYYPQDSYEGNDYEIHVKPDWSYEEFTSVFADYLVEGHAEGEIGVFVLAANDEIRQQYKKLKIAIYTICKNEVDSVERWANSNSEADIRLVCDTGSTDGTPDKLREHGVLVYDIAVKPWRFDTARNASLNLLPPDVDICIWQDLDEALLPGWRQAIEQAWVPGTTVANHRYRYNGAPWQWHYKIHARRKCRWRFPVHEKLLWAEDVVQHNIWIPDFYLDEQQAPKESRGGYIDLLELKISEGDTDWKTHAFLAGEYAGRGNLEKELQARIQAYETCNDGGMVRSYCARLVANVYQRMGDYTQSDNWYFRGIQDSAERETFYHWALSYRDRQDWESCYFTMKKAFAVQHRSDGFTQDPSAWSWPAYDVAAIAAYNIGMFAQAVELGKQALQHAPEDARLQQNQNFYEDKLNG